MARTSIPPSEPTKDEESEGLLGGVLSWFIGVFSGGADPDRVKRRVLKEIGKDLASHRFKFYKTRGEQAQPALARFLFEIYKVVANAGTILRGAEDSAGLRSITIELFMTERQRAILDHFSEQSIRERARNTDTKVLAASLKDDMVEFFSGFEASTIREINNCYNNIIHFLRFIHFDYFFVLKKFDSSLQEGAIGGAPKFEALNAEYVLDDLKDFLEVGQAITAATDWDQVFTMLMGYKNVEMISRPAWKRLVALLDNVVRSGVLLSMIRHIEKDPYVEVKPNQANEHIVEPYLNKIKAQTEAAIQQVVADKRGARVDQLAKAVFGTTAVHRTKYYTEKANLTFSKKIATGYLYVEPINYLKAYLVDIYKKDIRELQDLILVRGKWTANEQSQQLSDSYHLVLTISDQIVAFDESLADDGELGSRVRRAAGRVVERDPSTAKSLQQLLMDVNNKALALVNEAALALIAVGKSIKMAMDDYPRTNHEVITNWKEIESLSEVPIDERMSDAYKKMVYFLQLLQMFVKPSQNG